MVKTAVILAGGEGTRLRPLTYEIPKPLIPIRGRPLIEHVIEKLKEADVETIFISVGYMSDKIKDYFSDRTLGVNIKYIIEEEPFGTGGFLNLISRDDKRKYFSKDFIVVNGDNLFDLCWKKMFVLHNKEKAYVTISLTRVNDVTSCGVVLMDGNKIIDFVEKPSKEYVSSNMISAGYYIFSPKVFSIIPEEKKFMLEKDVFPKLAKENKLAGYYDEGQWFDTGTFERWEKAIKGWKLRGKNI